MIVEALKNFDFDNVDKVYFGFLNEHIEKYNCRYAIEMCIDELGIKDKAEVVILSDRTNNQPHTVYEVIKQASIEGQIIIKEVDNRFSYGIEDGNFMCYYDLNDTTSINPSNKSYITIGDDGGISDLVEKKGGLSGKPLFETSNNILKKMYNLTNGQIILIGVLKKIGSITLDNIKLYL